MLCLASAIFPVLILYSWRTSGSYLQRWMVDFYNDGESVVMSFISRSLLLLWNLSFVHADCAVHVTQTAQSMHTSLSDGTRDQSRDNRRTFGGNSIAHFWVDVAL